MISTVSPATKRALAGGLLLAAALILLVLGTGASNDDGGGSYKVRAIFDSASFLVPGEDVKVSGVKIGHIESLDVTPQNKAAIVLQIDDPAYRDFKRDAFCTIRLQSLIGEKFVACQPTQAKSANSEPAPALRRIEHGDGKGQYLLPVSNTSAPVDLDMLNNIMRLPERQRFAIIINELGVGLAGNGRQLNDVIRRANPTLYQLDRVLAILASQNRVLADLARDSDAALAPTARESRSISTFIDKAGATAAATAARGDDLEQNFAKFPAFLTQLRPTMRRLGEFAAAGTPVMTDLRAAAPSINTIFRQLGPFSTAALPTFRTLGELADTGREALPAAEPIIRDIRGFAVEAKPFADVLARGLVDLQRQHGIERLLDVILYTAGTSNGFDELGHYLRTWIKVDTACLPYAVVPSGTHNTQSCVETSANFNAGAAASTSVTPPADALSASTPAQSGGASLIDERASTPTGAPATSAPAGSGVLNYLLGGSGGR